MVAPLTLAEIEELERLLALEPILPWVWVPFTATVREGPAHDPGEGIALAIGHGTRQSETLESGINRAKLIAALRNAAPALLAAARRVAEQEAAYAEVVRVVEGGA